jgi:hypothetical protein
MRSILLQLCHRIALPHVVCKVGQNKVSHNGGQIVTMGTPSFQRVQDRIGHVLTVRFTAHVAGADFGVG